MNFSWLNIFSSNKISSSCYLKTLIIFLTYFPFFKTVRSYMTFFSVNIILTTFLFMSRRRGFFLMNIYIFFLKKLFFFFSMTPFEFLFCKIFSSTNMWTTNFLKLLKNFIITMLSILELTNVIFYLFLDFVAKHCWVSNLRIKLILNLKLSYLHIFLRYSR